MYESDYMPAVSVKELASVLFLVSKLVKIIQSQIKSKYKNPTITKDLNGNND